MVLTVNNISAASVRSDGTISIDCQGESGATDTIVLARTAFMELILHGLCASSENITRGAPYPTLRPVAVSVALTSKDEVGLNLYLTPEKAISTIIPKLTAQEIEENLKQLRMRAPRRETKQ